MKITDQDYETHYISATIISDLNHRLPVILPDYVEIWLTDIVAKEIELAYYKGRTDGQNDTRMT